ncbi:hypothetical protein [Amnibacterium endophyticum]|uniref:DprA winged helix domain-containing protein n=1 Tax=Amnibacterium endophyticum TaxID=2109337 RepID=A0ABW4LA68_9MICO
MSPVQRAVLRRLEQGPATLAGLRAAFPDGSAESRALMSMGEEDPFGRELVGLVADGLVVEHDGRYRLADPARGGS